MKKLPFFLPFGGCVRRCAYCQQKTITGAAELTPPDKIAKILSLENEPKEICFFGGSFCRFNIEDIRSYLNAVKKFAPPGSRIRFSTYPGDLRNAGLRLLLSSYDIACVELGIPSLDPAVLCACSREADPETIISELTTLRDESFPIGVQVMIGLPTQTVESSLRDIDILAKVKGVQDWDLRIYPTLVLEDTELCQMMNRSEYKPLSINEAIEWGGILLDAAETRGFRPIRVGLQESAGLISQVRGGPSHPAIGELIAAESLALKLRRANPRGSWTIPSSHISKLTGHHRIGIKRLAFHSRMSESKVASLIKFFSDR